MVHSMKILSILNIFKYFNNTWNDALDALIFFFNIQV